jgi:hypothetical protein
MNFFPILQRMELFLSPKSNKALSASYIFVSTYQGQMLTFANVKNENCYLIVVLICLL